MQDNFSGITLVDTKIQCSKIDEEAKKQRHVRLLTSEAFERDKKKYDAIFIICVLHIVPSVRERREIIDAAVGKLNDRGMIVVDVPQSETYYNRKKDSLLPYQDGHLLKWGSSYTFYKSFFREEFDDLFMRTGALEIADQVYQSKHLIRMWRKKDKA
jgi:2-polyprenyl-3-methyl-5-hydroxy-6-metoxy-1,4-benzoquinol methylase